MQKTNFSKKFCILFVTVVLMSLLAVSSLAAVTYENGTIKGLLPNAEYQYTYVTLENYNTSLEQIDVSGSEFTTITADKYGKNDTVTDAGIIYIVKADDPADDEFVWIEGDGLARSNIGKRNANGTIVAKGTNKAENYLWTEGTWILKNNGTSIHQQVTSPDYISSSGGYVFSSDFCTTVLNHSDDPEVVAQAKANLEGLQYKYAYQPSEIIPVEELKTFNYNTGLREGCLNAVSPSGQPFLTKVVLYTLNETGMVTAHTWTEATKYFTASRVGSGNGNIGANKKMHTISIDASFPDAVGYVMGIEVYPYAVVPEDVEFYVNGRHAAFGEDPENPGLSKAMYTSYIFEPLSSGYTTVYKHNETNIPSQYNGANSAYIEGYADGTFKPEANITKAEAATIISRLIFGEKELPIGYVSEFEDVTADAWYYNTIAYLEAQGVFDYIEGTELEPNAVLTRGELAQMVSAFIDLTEATAKITFIDVTEDNVYYNAIITLANAGIINGYEDGTFKPEGNITRAEAVTLFNRLVNLNTAEDAVVTEGLEISFNDIADEWYTNDILVAANDNVKTPAQLNSESALQDSGNTIVIETSNVTIKINKSNAKISEIINKADGTNVVAASLSPYFATITSNSGLTYIPKSAEIVDGRLEIVFGNGMKAYFIVEAEETFFTVQLDSELPIGVKTIRFGVFGITSATDEYRISAVSMDTRVNNEYNPGGASKVTAGGTTGTLDSVLGAKVGITFAAYADDAHRNALKDINNAIDITKGIKSNAGGAYVFDNKVNGNSFLDTVIVRDTTADQVLSYINVAPKYSIDVIQVHQLNNTYRQGDFNFSNSLGSNASSLIAQYGNSAKAYKAVVSDAIYEAGMKLSFHTYSAGMKDGAFRVILSEHPEWIDQVYFNPAKYTLAADIDATVEQISIKEGTEGIRYPNDEKLYTTGSEYAAVPYSTMYTAYFKIDNEIVQIKWQYTAIANETTINVYRGQLGTTKAAHSEGAEIKQILGIHQCIQPVAGSELFYEIARRTAQAYNEADFDMIYLDGQDSIIRFVEDQENLYFYLADFVRVILENIDDDKAPVIEGSAFSANNMYAAGGKYGAVDAAVRGIKVHKKNHFANYVKPTAGYYYTATLGWFNFNPDGADTYKNTLNHTLFRDDLDYMGSLAIAYDVGMTYLSVPGTYSNATKTSINLNYYGVYSRLRKAGYFSEAVKEAIRNGEYEYRLIKEADGSYAFQEMTYANHKVFDADFATGSATNPFEAATPLIRIEQNYTAAEGGYVLLDLDETEAVKNSEYTFEATNIKDKALKVNVTGNGKKGAILVSLYSTTTPATTSAHADYLIPTSHTGTKEFTLIETVNGDYDGFSFSGIGTGIAQWGTHGAGIDLSRTKMIRIRVAGDVTDVTMNDIYYSNIESVSAKNPSVTIGDNTIKFVTGSTAFNSGSYIEYYPVVNKAYLHNYSGSTYNATEIAVQGSVTAPNGDFTYTYSVEEGSPKAKVVIGMQGEKIANEVNPEAPAMEDAKLYPLG